MGLRSKRNNRPEFCTANCTDMSRSMPAMLPTARACVGASRSWRVRLRRSPMAQLAARPIQGTETHRRRTPDLARDVDAGAYLETLLVAAVSSVLLTRLYLQITGFPQIGSGGLHLAHLLWGGLLMLVSLVLMLATLGKRQKHLSATVGGIGFGLFIDELGKFVTSDNNYFFQPAVSLIYVILVLLFLLTRAIVRREPSPMEALVNAADLVRE